MAVAKDAISLVVATSGAPAGGLAAFLTVGASATFLLVMISVDNTSPGVPTAHWDSAGTNQAMTQVGSTITNATGGFSLCFMGLVNPTAGSKTLTFAFGTSGNNAYAAGESFTGTVTSSVAAATEGAATATGNSTTAAATTAVSIPSGDMAVAWTTNVNGYTGDPMTPNAVQADGGKAIGDNQSLTHNAAGEYYSGAGSAISCSLGGPTGQWAAAIVGIKAPGGAVVPVLALPRRIFLKRRWQSGRSPLGDAPMRKQRAPLVPDSRLILPRRAA